MAGGRPTKYTEDRLALARDYPYNFKSEYGHSFPSIVGLAKVIKVDSETIRDWAKQPDKQEFSGIVRDVLDYQHFELAENGVTGKFNSNITKLLLAKHGHSDKQEIDQNLTAKHDHTVQYGDPVIDALKNKHKT